MDERDREILRILADDGRAPYTEIADEIGVSEGTVRNRVQAMEEEGVIQRFTVETNQGSTALVMVDLSTDHAIDDVVDAFPQGITVYEIAGEHDLVLRFSRATVDELNDTLDTIRGIDGVRDTRTYTVLKHRQT
ncbi:MAG: Lrp/AsnC family transcriptional regulator [Candidatus Nanohaloarchaea archaeon]|nr:Lrp/AsnC family transcriptional regulator [Candidatus Nanohaloarchaea archaeon]